MRELGYRLEKDTDQYGNRHLIFKMTTDPLHRPRPHIMYKKYQSGGRGYTRKEVQPKAFWCFFTDHFDFTSILLFIIQAIHGYQNKKGRKKSKGILLQNQTAATAGTTTAKTKETINKLDITKIHCLKPLSFVL